VTLSYKKKSEAESIFLSGEGKRRGSKQKKTWEKGEDYREMVFENSVYNFFQKEWMKRIGYYAMGGGGEGGGGFVTTFAKKLKRGGRHHWEKKRGKLNRKKVSYWKTREKKKVLTGLLRGKSLGNQRKCLNQSNKETAIETVEDICEAELLGKNWERLRKVQDNSSGASDSVCKEGGRKREGYCERGVRCSANLTHDKGKLGKSENVKGGKTG